MREQTNTSPNLFHTNEVEGGFSCYILSQQVLIHLHYGIRLERN
jgi:hypothetical protein